ncbi:hypothetical protein [Aestuariivivens sediminicola]|uniref:hypothetical protein n=1 Tax=Aestuariivivens sediminicola TaxID=2913560 RepID=UPI001F57894A|nr:hypothetical protein [Aestuariivivens sediminicola]
MENGYTPSWFKIEEENYFYGLQSYLKNNPNKHETDFINSKIKSLEDTLKTKVDDNKKRVEFRLAYYLLKRSHLEVINKKEGRSKGVTIDGRIPNLSERYQIADSVLDIDSLIRKLNVSDKKKYQLVAIILGCDETNARHLMNGKYPGKVRESEINNYLQTLKK